MRNIARTLATSLTQHNPFRADRGPETVAAPLDSTLNHLRFLGYHPHLILACGAGLRRFAGCARRHFPTATVHFADSTPADDDLRRLACQHGFVIHACSLRATDARPHRQGLATANRGIASALIDPDRPGAPASLDQLFAGAIAPILRTLLVVDLQGKELQALRGAQVLLPGIEVVIATADPSHSTEGSSSDLRGFMDLVGFEVLDGPPFAPRRGTAQRDLVVFVRTGSGLARQNRPDKM
jgi:hypothetical protein